MTDDAPAGVNIHLRCFQVFLIIAWKMNIEQA